MKPIVGDFCRVRENGRNEAGLDLSGMTGVAEVVEDGWVFVALTAWGGYVAAFKPEMLAVEIVAAPEVAA